MIIEFSVANFKSIRERQTLSMVAGGTKDKSHPENLIDVPLPGLAKTKLLKSAVLYGPNASGKSNIFKALVFMDRFVEHPPFLKSSATTGVEAFRLDATSVTKPSEFEITFVCNNVRHQYGFAVDATRVHEEWLYVYPKGNPQKWFERILNPDTGDYLWEFSQKHFRGDKESVKKATPPNCLFLSIGAILKHEQLEVIYKWFEELLWHADLARVTSTEWLPTTRLMMSHDELRKRVPGLLYNADLGVRDVRASEEEFDVDVNTIPDLPPDAPSEDQRAREEIITTGKIKFPMTTWIHGVESSDYTCEFDLDHESAGTQRYFSFLGPWLKTLECGVTFFVDELGANIHPHLVRGLLKMLNSPRDNPNNAQLIFTTHDVTLLDQDIFRRDQIWLTEKNQEGATRLYPLTDFQPRQGESLLKGYMAGRYGAIPFLRGELALR